eukprot:1910430-Pleurochrysis_carterae.AAC.1
MELYHQFARGSVARGTLKERLPRLCSELAAMVREAANVHGEELRTQDNARRIGEATEGLKLIATELPNTKNATKTEMARVKELLEKICPMSPMLLTPNQ